MYMNDIGEQVYHVAKCSMSAFKEVVSVGPKHFQLYCQYCVLILSTLAFYTTSESIESRMLIFFQLLYSFINCNVQIYISAGNQFIYYFLLVISQFH